MSCNNVIEFLISEKINWNGYAVAQPALQSRGASQNRFFFFIQLLSQKYKTKISHTITILKFIYFNISDMHSSPTTVNSLWYTETLLKLRIRVCNISRSTKTILLQHDNARPHTLQATCSDALKQFKFEIIQHPQYSSDLAPCDFHFFWDLKRDLKGIHFTLDEEVEKAVKSWINDRPATNFSNGMKNLWLVRRNVY